MRVFPLLAVMAMVIPAARAAADEPRSISTTGEALVQVAPDTVVVGLGVESFRPTPDAAREANEAECARLVAAIKALGVAEADLQTDVLNVELAYHDGSHP